MTKLGPIVPPDGPHTAPIVLLGECPDDDESARSIPFVGRPGQELRRMLSTIGLSIHETYRTYVFNRQPPENDIAVGFGTTTPSDTSRRLGPLTSQPKTWIADIHLPRLTELYSELSTVQPNIIIALGNTATWALGLGIGISDLRGNLYQVQLPNVAYKTKVLPTFAPASVIRQWSQRPVVIADLQKAFNNAESPTLTFDNSELWLAPTYSDILEFDKLFMQRAGICASDIETSRGQITCISFAPSSEVSICIPFWQKGLQPNYWPDPEEELAVWRIVKHWIERTDLVKIFQNGLYDLQYLSAYGIHPRACTEDTMLIHHSLYSELPKGLGFLGSLYANVPAWKKMRRFKSETAELKREE